MNETQRSSPREAAWASPPSFPQQQSHQTQGGTNSSSSSPSSGFPPRQNKKVISQPQQYSAYGKDPGKISSTAEGIILKSSTNPRPPNNGLKHISGAADASAKLLGGSTSNGVRERIEAHPSQSIGQPQRSMIPPPPPPPPPKHSLNKIPRPGSTNSLTRQPGSNSQPSSTSGPQSAQSHGSTSKNNAAIPPLSAFATETLNWPSATSSISPEDQEQTFFEQRLCEDVYGVAVRKINQNGKSNLRYVRCCWVDASELVEDSQRNSSSGSVSSRRSAFSLKGLRSSINKSSSDRSLTDRSDQGFFRRGGNNEITTSYNVSSITGSAVASSSSSVNNRNDDKVRVLTWGKKKDIMIPLEKFICVRKGKTTERARRNPSPSSRILSLIANDIDNSSLDIEAPTTLDRDKFARAFAQFLNIPLQEGGGGDSSVQGRASSVASTSRGTYIIPYIGHFDYVSFLTLSCAS